MTDTPPDALFRLAEDVDTCPDCEFEAADVWFEQSPAGRWFLEVTHTCHRSSEQFYV